MTGIRRARRTRLLGATLTALAAMALVAESAFAAVSWAPIREVADAFTYNTEQSLARTVKSGKPYLHAVYGDTKIGDGHASDSGPFAGVYYARGNNKGKGWDDVKRLNPKSKHATSPAIVANGDVLYAAYVSIGHWISYDPAEPRRLTLRINHNHGGKKAWLKRKVTMAENRVDRPWLAPWTDRGVLVAYTDADTGSIVVVTCGDLTVEENGCAATSVGTTTRLAFDPDDGFEGLPVVAASGDDITVAWLTAEEGGIAYRTKDGEADWSEPTELTAAVADSLSIAARGTRVGFSWAEVDAGIKVRMLVDGVLDATRTIFTPNPTGTYKNAYSTAIALAGTSTVGVAFAACRRADCEGRKNTGVDLRWRESGDNGAIWTSPQTIAIYSSKASRRINDFPSVMMSTKKRFVMYNGGSASFSTYRVLIRVGSG